MRVALVAPPFISIPPKQYGGTELFIAELALGLKAEGIDVVLYANGESTVEVETHSLYEKAQWPIRGEIYDNMKDAVHTSWAIRHAMDNCDLIHVNNATALAFSRFVPQPMVYTVHHPKEAQLTELYGHFQNVSYVCISHHQSKAQGLRASTVIHHGLDWSGYKVVEQKKEYLSFIGRIAPVKGVHLAIDVAQKMGIPLKIAGEVQPMFQEYFDKEIKPKLDGKLIEYIGEADLVQKNELLGNSLAMLFPIQWDEPFGLVMVESMACGTPVLAFPGGSVPEIVKDGVSGYICTTVDEMAARAKDLAGSGSIPAQTVRSYLEENFSIRKMVSAYIDLYTGLISGKSSGHGEKSSISIPNPPLARAVA